MQKFEVEVKNEILGNSKHVMRMDQIARFNLVAKALAIQAANDGQEHSSGMWTVRPHTANDLHNWRVASAASGTSTLMCLLCVNL